MKEILIGIYARHIYLSGSDWSRRWRKSVHRIRGKQSRFLQQTSLPRVCWQKLFRARWSRVWEAKRANGNIRISELGILSAAAAECPPATNIFEIGTFDGRTTLNLTLNSAESCKVFTLDLPANTETKFALAKGEKHMVRKEESGARFHRHRATVPKAIARITQLFGDSAQFDFRPFHRTCSLVFVDGSHTYEYVHADTKTAIDLARPGAVILWHDYGIWEGVTRALEEVEAANGLGLRNIAGTSLVYWRAPLEGAATAFV